MAACEANPDYSPGELLATKMQYFPSQHMMISCGCVPVDPVARKIAILRDTVYHLVQLPKGRKNIGEDLLATALRETHEETGVRFSALPLKVATRATPTPEMAESFVPGENPDVTEGLLNCEVSSVCSYPCIYTGAFKVVFWFAAQGNSTDIPEEGTKESWEEHTVMEWVDAHEAAGMMSFKADRDVIEKVLSDMRHSGYDI
ncbi:hypothetical protein B0J13DRAFT_171425 [Dactylonectria estremocensis]|uniref:Nudix hydrolase domain-containing protein n=1 Tax=Dactylonectria estremocensis TaxID=1079267 RepID=A0A9P9J9L9_9HYPO|nr:hypothetical protein B0J13DRAFT_171425 [Dactylonectria estremocensis]